MAREPQEKDTPMAKVSKSLMINAELAQLLDAVSDTTGATFTRIVTAALIHHFLGDLQPPDFYWMQLASALERGESTLFDLVFQIADHRIEKATSEVKSARERRFVEGTTNTHLAHTDELRGMEIGTKMALAKISKEYDDKLRWIIERWTRRLSHRPSHDDAID